MSWIWPVVEELKSEADALPTAMIARAVGVPVAVVVMVSDVEEVCVVAVMEVVVKGSEVVVGVTVSLV